MPSAKAQENKTLTAACVGCQKVLSTELLSGVVVGRGRAARSLAVCQACRDKGWSPERQATPAES